MRRGGSGFKNGASPWRVRPSSGVAGKSESTRQGVVEANWWSRQTAVREVNEDGRKGLDDALNNGKGTNGLLRVPDGLDFGGADLKS